jgi:hypothetical protein
MLYVASWKEFFSNTPNIDRLNNNSGRILQAAHRNATATPLELFTGLSYLTSTCTLAASLMAGHVWFAHHFGIIGNPTLNGPADLNYVVLCGIGEGQSGKYHRFPQQHNL